MAINLTLHIEDALKNVLVLNLLCFFCEQFGGKLVTLDNIKPTAQQPQQTAAHVVHISQVVTETDFIDRSNQLQTTLTAGNFLEYCQNKIEAAQNEFEKTVWSFLKVRHFIRNAYLFAQEQRLSNFLSEL